MLPWTRSSASIPSSKPSGPRPSGSTRSSSRRSGATPGSARSSARPRPITSPCVFVPARRLDQIAPGHQGVMAEVSPKEYVRLEDILARSPKPFVVILDEVEDPQNLGAIVRSAEGAGADGIVLPERRSAGLTETVDQVSAGALEHLPVARVTNLVRAMEELKDKGLWLVGAEGSGEEPWYAFDYTGPVGIVLGSEGKGLRPLVRKTCDKVLAIPLAGKVGLPQRRRRRGRLPLRGRPPAARSRNGAGIQSLRLRPGPA
ncbi:MAG: 23S rRNA (guanosine(2251)-2'-O)-methyltransferase RlmB [Comamonadaceae bacterium]|nr:23S rRNA (guanosine(2251)-2'-O)-methyltransferase RlmB [Comamonadaceae bacterium]